MPAMLAAWIAGICLLLGLSPAAPAQMPETTALHIVVQGDLDSAWMARRIADELETASDQDSPLVILELATADARLDVAWAVAEAVEACTCPVVVVIEGEKKRAGPGALLIGLLAPECYLARGVRLEGVWDPQLRLLAPGETRWDRVERAASGELWARLREGRADPALASIIVTPDRSAWIGTGSDTRLAVTFDTPADGEGRTEEKWQRAVTVSPMEASRVTISAKLLILAEIASEHEGVEALLRDRGIRSRPDRIEVVSPLATAREELERAIASLDASAAKADRDLNAAETSAKGRRPGSVLIPAGRSALEILDGAIGALDAAEGRVVELPELLRFPPPGSSEATIPPPDDRPEAWKEAIEAVRARGAEIRARASALADP